MFEVLMFGFGLIISVFRLRSITEFLIVLELQKAIERVLPKKNRNLVIEKRQIIEAQIREELPEANVANQLVLIKPSILDSIIAMRVHCPDGWVSRVNPYTKGYQIKYP
jgi:hypothetical protein